ncbi:MAG: hypothetical protein EHM65_06825, partial [Acidobacteriales bacterium]
MNFDVAQISFLGGPWDGAVVRLGKQFGIPDHLYIQPFFILDSSGMITIYPQSGFVADHPGTNTAAYHIAYAGDPAPDENGNLKSEFAYLYDKLRKWRVTRA